MITVHDLSAVLTPSGLAELQQYPTKYDVTVEFNGQWPTLDGLTQAAHNCISNPNKICVFVDPQHKHVAVRFGTDTGVAPANFDMVSKAGNASFHAGDWVNGVKGILSRAEVTSTKSNQPTAVIVQQPVIEHPMPVWPWLLGFGILAVLGWVVIAMARKRTRKLIEEADSKLDDVRREAGELAQRNIKEQAWADRIEETTRPVRSIPARPARVKTPVPAKPAQSGPEFESMFKRTPSRGNVGTATPRRRNTPEPAVVVVNQGNNDLLTGMLVGEAMTRRRLPTPEPVRRHRTPTPEPSRSSWSSRSSDDGGGSSSIFSSSDSGGSGGSFDGGGSCDSGGGGGDF